MDYMGVEWVDLAGVDLLVLGVMVALATGPYVSASRGGTSLALATVLSLMLVAFVQFTYSVLYGVPMQFSWMIDLLGIKPGVMGDPAESYRMLSAAWLHADWVHVLSNILVIALVGIPLEQRLGGRRWLAVYFLGFLGGNLAWVLSHPDSLSPAIGASGAAFGLLGAYMASFSSGSA
jgi:membrane associated rhomboid family serine protease